MASSTGDLDPAFQGAGRKEGMEIWRIENFRPVPVPENSYGNFFTGDSYIILKTTALKSGALRHDIHYWLGKDTSQDEAGSAAILTVELDEALGGGPVQYREVQGNESDKFLSYFNKCILPQKGGVASGFKHAEINARDHVTRLYQCKGLHVKEVPVDHSSLNHGDIFILDTDTKIYQFNGSKSSIMERGKAMEVVQQIKDTYHEGSCDVAIIEDAEIVDDAEGGEFWGFFGGFAPISEKSDSEDSRKEGSTAKLLCVHNGKAEPVGAGTISRDLLETNKCYLLDCGPKSYVWVGKNTSFPERKSASKIAEELLHDHGRKNASVIRILEGSEVPNFKSQFSDWPESADETDD